MQRTKSKILSILLSLVMLLSLLPTTALAANYSRVSVNNVLLENGHYLESNSSTSAETGANTEPSTYVAWYKDGVLTLNNFTGKLNSGIAVQGATAGDLTIKLIGNNTITPYRAGIEGNSNGGSITITSDSKGKLDISLTTTDQSAKGIDGIGSSVTITGSADVRISTEAQGTTDNSYGIYAESDVSILGSASVNITGKTPNNTRSNSCCGIHSKNVTINTDGTIKIDVKDAGNDDADSYGVYAKSSATLTKVKEMQVKWKKGDSYAPGGAIYPSTSFSNTDYAVNVDTTKCFASYRKGNPYQVTVENGTLTCTDVVLHPKESGNFLAGDTVNITPSEKKSSDGTLIPFKEWTAEGLMLTSPATENNSFTVPANAVTVTATYNPFDGTPVFTPTGSTSTEGTLTFKTKVKPSGGSEYFRLVKEGNKNNESSYILINPDTTSTSSPYEYSYETSIYNLNKGNYYVAEYLDGDYYLSEKFTVNYTAAPTPSATVGDVTIDGTTGTAITDKDVVITLTNDEFKAIAADADVSGWFTTLPAGLDAKIKTAVSENDTTATIEISGTPTETSSAALAITIPAANLVSNTALTVTNNPSAVFAITAAAIPIAVPTANTGLVYNGTKQTGVNAGTGYTLGGVYEATDVGATNYTATATLNPGYKWSDDGTTDAKTITWNIGKRTPTPTDFTFAPPTDLTYDGNNKTASVTLKSPFTNSGAINVKYEKSGTPVTETKDVGTYTVKIDVAGGDNFNAGSNLNDPAWTFSIAPANQSAPTGLGVAAPTASGGNGKITGTTIAMEYSTDSGFTSPTDCSATETEVAPGTYYVRFKADANHNAGAVSAALVVPGYSATKYTVTVTYDANGTAIADKTTDVAAGETVTLTATPNTGYVFDEWVEKNPTSLIIGTDGKFNMPGENVSVKATFKGAALTGTASITGTEKFGQTLTASLVGTNNTGTLTYKWYRSGEAAEIANNTTGKYTLVEDDIGKTITVKITSDVQTGEIPSSATGTIDRADGPAAPTAFTLTFTPNADGTTFTATIPAFAGGEYSFDGATYSTTNTKTDCAANTSYTGYARVKETATHKTGTEISDTQTSPKLTVATPTFTPNGASSFTGTQSVTISCTTAGAKIYYTTDGTTPTTTSTEYTTALSLTSTTTVKAIAVNTGMNDSAIATATFTKYSGGGGGGGSSSGGGGSYSPSYSITPGKSENGSITVSPKSARKGDTVTITVTPDKGYELEDLTVLDSKGKELALTEKNGKYSFKMPAGKVEVKATFIKEAEISPFDDVSTNAYYYEAVKWAQEKGITGGIGNKLFGPNDPCTRAQIVTFLWRAAGSPAPKNTGTAFGDVKPGSFYEQAVAWAVENGITGGTGDGMFSPDATCTRAQSVTFLYRAAGSPAVSGSAEFGDVATNAYYADAVAWAAKNGVTDGIGGGQFGSGNDCTRGQIVTFLYRAYNK